ncbi:MAG: hypothetical protein IID03_05390 [Candidatus Dadabacteria bacterium]|nr:hypothetical protein [Candidatus Dadabacteria bacterium]
MGYPIISRAINFLLITLTAITIFSGAYNANAAVFNVPAGDVPTLIAAITTANTNTEPDI